MRLPASLALVALLLALVAGCQLKNDNKNCVGEPGEAGGGVSVCTQPPPSQFNQLGN
jgi:hypothetical protein